MYKTIDAAFPETYAFALYGRRHASTNIILVAINDDERLSAADWLARAEQYESKSYVDRSQVRRMIDDLIQTLPDMKGAAEFTDDYAPIETMSF
jgi:hypothetical protein